jgi:hypothetical protein
MFNSSEQQGAQGAAPDQRIEREIFGGLAPLVAEMNESELLALAERAEAHVGSAQVSTSNKHK